MFCAFLVIWDFLEYFEFKKESRATRTKSNPAVGSFGGKESVVERTARDTTSRER